MMIVRVACKRKLLTDEESKTNLNWLYEEANRLVQDISTVIEKRKLDRKIVIQKYYYKLWKDKYPDLPSQIIINCIDKVVEAYKSAWENSNPLPSFDYLPVRLARNRSYKIDEDGNIRINTSRGKGNYVTGRVKNLTYPVELAKGAELMRGGDGFELVVTFEKRFEMYNPEYAVGIDFNTDCYAVVVVDRNRQIVGHKFFPHKFINIVEYYSSKRKHRRLKKQKMRNRLKEEMEKVMNEIIEYILDFQPSYVFIEELDSIGKKTALLCKNKLKKNQYHHLPFKKGYDYLTTRLMWNEVVVDDVYPYYTSKSCWICGKRGERKGKSFKCKEHGEMHADYNAGANIALGGMRKRKKRYESTHSSQP